MAFGEIFVTNKLYCKGGSFSHHCNPHRFLQPVVLRLYFPTLEPWVAVCLTPNLLLLVYPHTNVGMPGPPAPRFCMSSPPWLPISAPPTSLDECLFFNSLVVRLPYSLISWQFWLFFIFKFVVFLLWVV